MALPCPVNHFDGLFDEGKDLPGSGIEGPSLCGNETACCGQEDGLQHGGILMSPDQFITSPMGGSAMFDQPRTYQCREGDLRRVRVDPSEPGGLAQPNGARLIHQHPEDFSFSFRA